MNTLNNLSRNQQQSMAAKTIDHNHNMYATLAKTAYAIGEKEGWTTQKIFQMLSDPQKMHKYIELVNIATLISYRKNPKPISQW